ncbi:zinc-ribbon domain-containing protein [Umezawaea sp. Da 62-37]|uniref:zinc-ribbon domain-containing protein n=1 Tax=Umezawaea sp. Da 62-37 TaxID=3075927 RepID=UPI0028F71009|nr:zinc-ribbon domain-containing protein [Umezawaea sp. Da 62-37]WNV85617.1 zinc-ribbon domain-containing protein [Umezawaea sp. Da 62-37]
MVIFGFRTKVFVLAMLTLLCPRCGNSAAHPVHRAVTKFTLFFIPLFPVKTRYSTQCTFCGLAGGLSKDQATHLLRQANGPLGSPHQV